MHRDHALKEFGALVHRTGLCPVNQPLLMERDDAKRVGYKVGVVALAAGLFVEGRVGADVLDVDYGFRGC